MSPWSTLYNEEEMLNVNWLIRGLADGGFPQRDNDPIVISRFEAMPQQSISSQSNRANSFIFDTAINGIHPDIMGSARVFESYNVYRSNVDEIDDESSWVTLVYEISAREWVDHTWGALDIGEYQYIIRAVYTNDNLSAPAFSDVLEKTVATTPAEILAAQINNWNHGVEFHTFLARAFIDSQTVIVTGELIGTKADVADGAELLLYMPNPIRLNWYAILDGETEIILQGNGRFNM
jgi:hypothetical protein